MAFHNTSVLRTAMLVVLVLGAITVLFLMYFKSFPSKKCHPPPAHWARQAKQENSDDMSEVSPGNNKANKPMLLLWFWPEDKRFDLQDCKKFFKIDNCQLTDDRALTSKAHGVLIFHKAISKDLSNLPTVRTRFQRWIWFNMDTPTNTHRIPGIQSLFNLTMTYRKDSDIQVRWKVTARKSPNDSFVLPKKERLLCWIVDKEEMNNKSGESYKRFIGLSKHIEINLFEKSSDDVKGEKYFTTISSCKFYLSFESSIHQDYITEKFTGPLATRTVPVVLGPSRKNYENFAPGSSFIHVDDFPDSTSLVAQLQKLDKDKEAYMRFFDWWKFYTLGRPLADEKYEFLHAVCLSCRHLGLTREFRYVPDLYKWFVD